MFNFTRNLPVFQKMAKILQKDLRNQQYFVFNLQIPITQQYDGLLPVMVKLNA